MIILYSNDCPKCKVLKKKLDEKGIEYIESHSIDEMIALGMTSAPALLVEGELLPFSKAVMWVKNQ